MEISDVVNKKHITYTKDNEVREICKPLFDAFNVSALNYSRVYTKDNTMLSLETYGEAFRSFCENSYPASGTMLKNGITFWTEYQPEALLQDSARYFNEYHGITISFEKKDHIECFNIAFGIDDPAVVGPLINNFDAIEKFSLYFKDKAADLIKEADQQRIILPGAMIGGELKPKNYQEFYDAIKANKAYLDTDNGVVILSKREYEILLLFAFGRSSKEIGQTLKISYRTVGCHLDNIKRKTKCISRLQLVEMLHYNLLILRSNSLIMYG